MSSGAAVVVGVVALVVILVAVLRRPGEHWRVTIVLQHDRDAKCDQKCDQTRESPDTP